MQRDTDEEAKTTKSKNELLRARSDLILKTLSIESMHGYGIAQHIQMLSADVLTIEEGSLFRRCSGCSSRDGCWRVEDFGDNNRRARFYTLTTAGKSSSASRNRDSPRCSARSCRHDMRVMKTT